MQDTTRTHERIAVLEAQQQNIIANVSRLVTSTRADSNANREEVTEELHKLVEKVELIEADIKRANEAKKYNTAFIAGIVATVSTVWAVFYFILSYLDINLLHLIRDK